MGMRGALLVVIGSFGRLVVGDVGGIQGFGGRGSGFLGLLVVVVNRGQIIRLFGDGARVLEVTAGVEGGIYG